MSVFDDAKTDLRELLALVVEIDRLSQIKWGGRQFETDDAERQFTAKQHRAAELKEKYGL